MPERGLVNWTSPRARAVRAANGNAGAKTVASRDEFGTGQAKLTISPREHLLLQ